TAALRSRMDEQPLVRPEIIRAVTLRVMERLRTGGRVAGPSLPADKAQVPRLVCLDQQAWIGLARALYGHKEATKVDREALGALRAAISNGRVLAPVTDVAMFETSTRRDPESRSRLARAIVEISENTSLFAAEAIKLAELTVALEEV